MGTTTGTARWTTARWAALVAAGGLALAGCAGSGDESVSSGPMGQDEGGGATSSATSAAKQESSSSDSAAGSGSGDTGSSKRASDTTQAPSGTHVARTASLSITVDDVEKSTAQVRSAAARVDGYVSSEDSRADDGHRGDWAEVTVTVPVDDLDATMTRLADIGEVTHRSSEAEDLTAQYTDTEARVRTMTKSVERLRKLIDSAEGLDQVVTLESELSRREADLEAMTSQQKSLEKRTTTAPITVSLSTEDAPADEPEEERTGFLAGLGSGWSAFTGALTVGLTVLGAGTPFAVVGLVVGWPIARWLRRRRTSRPLATPTAPTAGA